MTSVGPVQVFEVERQEEIPDMGQPREAAGVSISQSELSDERTDLNEVAIIGGSLDGQIRRQH